MNSATLYVRMHSALILEVDLEVCVGGGGILSLGRFVITINCRLISRRCVLIHIYAMIEVLAF